MKRLDLDQVATFVALVDAGSFGRAARNLGLSQSAVSQHVRRLEDRLDVKLIERARLGSVPTAAAARLLPLARSLLRVERRACETASRQRLTLGACSNLGIYVLPDLMRAFADAGHVPPPLVIGDNPTTAARLDAGEIDVALMEWWDDRPGFVSEPWRTEPIVAIAPVGHAWSSLDAIPLAALASAPLIGGESGTGTGRLLRTHVDPSVPMPRPVLELGSTEAVKRGVAAGLGVSVVLALTVVREVRDGQLLARPLLPALTKTLHLVRRADLVMDPLFDFLLAAWNDSR
jgi:DNA-binding transcriptional LysR family regulator